MSKSRRRALMLLVALLLVAGSVAAKVLGMQLVEVLGLPVLWRNLTSGLLALIVIVAVGLLLERRYDAFRSPGYSFWPLRWGTRRGIGLGILVGGGMFLGVFGFAYGIGGIRIESRGVSAWGWLRLLPFMVVAGLINVVWEEYTFRGWPFAAAAKAIPDQAVVLLIGTIFGLAHLFSPDPSPAAIISVSFAGWLLGYALLWSGEISFPIGIHFGWNFVQGLLTTRLLWISHPHADPIRSGGKFGLEASLPGITVTVLAAVVMFVLYRRKREQIAWLESA